MRPSVLELGTTWAQLPPPTSTPSGGGRPVHGPITVTSPPRLRHQPPQEPMAQHCSAQRAVSPATERRRLLAEVRLTLSPAAPTMAFGINVRPA